MKKTIFFVLTLFGTSTLFAQTFIKNGINYTVTSPTTVEVGLNPDFTGSAVIPSNVSNGSFVYEVSRIGNFAFYNCTGLTSINIPNSVTNIGIGAFTFCLKIKSVIVSWSVPSEISLGLFEQSNRPTLYVPAGTLAAYKAAPVWKDFYTIFEGILPFTFNVSGINYALTSPTTIEVAENPSFSGKAIIPSSVTYLNTTYSVTGIGVQAFDKCTSLTSVNIPSSVTYIRLMAFDNCTGLKSVNIPNSVTYIGVAAFFYCKSLTSVTIPNSVSIIDGAAFAQCSGLTSINIPNSVKNIAGVFSGCSSLTSVTIPDSVINITNAFSACTSLTSINIPNSLTSIGSRAFENSGLTSVYIPNSVTTIKLEAFLGCENLSSLIIPNSVTRIDTGAFYFCRSLTTLNIPNSVTSFGVRAFSDCSSLTTVTVNWATPLPLTLDENVFASVPTSYATLYVPFGTLAAYKAAPVWKDFSTVIEMQPITFTDNGINYKVTIPTTVEVAEQPNNYTGTAIIPNSVTYLNTSYSISKIGDRSFSNCTGLTSINIPNSVTNIGYGAFYNCLNLTSISFPNTLTNIGNNAFQYCTGLTEIIIPNSLTNIGESVFDNCSNLKMVSIPNSVKTIGQSAFTYCGNLKTLNIPNSVTSISIRAFSNCTALTYINISNSVNSINDYAFASCSTLTSVIVNWTTPLVINANVFGSDSNTQIKSMPIASATLYVPIGTIAAYKAAPVWKDFGTILEQGTLPLTLTSLTAKAITTGNQINWTTANVVNVKNIILERSGVDKNFSTLGIVRVTASQFTDINPLPNDNYYRISTTDNDGNTNTYPQIAFVKGLNNDITFYPNPVTNGVLNVVAEKRKLHTVTLYDLNGKKVILRNILNNPNNVIINTEGLVKGIYILEINSEKNKHFKKVIVN